MKLNQIELSVIIISYHSYDVITQNLSSFIDGSDFHVYIVDNASPDQSAERLLKRFPHIHLIALEENIGYGCAANKALAKVTTPYALLLNPDITFEISALEKLLQHAKDSSNFAIIAPATDSPSIGSNPLQYVDWVSGCAMLFHMQKMSPIGFFDENIFLYFEETDLCKRVIQAGEKIILCSDVFFTHHSDQSSTPSKSVDRIKHWHYGWSRCYYFMKHRLNMKRRHPLLQLIHYSLKCCIAVNIEKKSKYFYRAQGAMNYIIRFKNQPPTCLN